MYECRLIPTIVDYHFERCDNSRVAKDDNRHS